MKIKDDYHDHYLKSYLLKFILEVDWEYLDELHAFQNDYPVAPEKLAIPYDMLSGYCKKIADKYGIKVDDLKKLIPNLGKKN